MWYLAETGLSAEVHWILQVFLFGAVECFRNSYFPAHLVHAVQHIQVSEKKGSKIQFCFIFYPSKMSFQ